MIQHLYRKKGDEVNLNEKADVGLDLILYDFEVNVNVNVKVNANANQGANLNVKINLIIYKRLGLVRS